MDQGVLRVGRDMSLSLWCEEEEEVQARGSAQLRAPWDPTVSGQRVIQRLLQVEERYTPSILYITLIQRDPARREELTKWALEVQMVSACFTYPTKFIHRSVYSKNIDFLLLLVFKNSSVGMINVIVTLFISTLGVL